MKVECWRLLDNPIAQGLLVKQLERYQLNVTATGNGDEALAGECSYNIGFLCSSTAHALCRMGVARTWLFQRCAVWSPRVCIPILYIVNTDTGTWLDMPICDGVEAAKRIRVMENKRKTSTTLPSEHSHLNQSLCVLNSHMNFFSCCPKCWLPRIHQTIMFKRWDEHVL